MDDDGGVCGVRPATCKGLECRDEFPGMQQGQSFEKNVFASCISEEADGWSVLGVAGATR